MRRFGANLLIVLVNAWVFPLVVAFSALGALHFPALLLGWKLVTRWSVERVMRHLIWLYGKVVLRLLWPFVRIRHDEFKQLRLPGIIVANHLSFADTYLLSLMPVWDVRICLRWWPFRMYWY